MKLRMILMAAVAMCVGAVAQANTLKQGAQEFGLSGYFDSETGSGADFQIIRRDGVAELEALYVIETEHGLVYVKNYGLRDGPKDVLDRLARGELVDPKLVYFRASPRFETAAPELQWMTKRIFVCSGARLPKQVVLRFFELL